MHPKNIEHCKMNAAYAIYQHCSRGNEKQDWTDAERLLARYPFTTVPHQEEMSYEAFQQEYGNAVYYHVMNHIFFLHLGMI